MQKKIVIVDDDYGIRDATKLIFEMAGYKTVVLPEPEPLYHGEHKDTNVILIDRQLSGSDGMIVCKELKQSGCFANTPILLMSATSHIPDNLQEWQIDGFIEKPFHKNELLKRIEQFLHG